MNLRHRPALGRVVLAVLAWVGLSCGPAEQPRGRAEVRRVVSLVPSVTDLLLALGQQDRLVARTRYDTTASLVALPAIGGTLDPSLERLVELEPDLVITGFPNQDGDVSGNLARAGIRTLRVHAETLDDVRRTLEALGNLLHLSGPADSLWSAIRDSMAAVRHSTSELPSPSVLFVTSVSPPMTVGPRTFVHELIETAGGRNVFDDVRTNWPTVSIESIVQRDPDLIILPVAAGDTMMAAELRRQPGFQSLRAIREGRVLMVDRDLFSRPGPRLHEAARILADYLRLSAPALSDPS